MKHLAKIQVEFLKEAKDWDNLSIEEQKGYIKRHPKSKRKITARPESSKNDKNDSKKNKKSVPGLDKIFGDKKEKIKNKVEKLSGPDIVSSTPILDDKLSKLFDAYSKFDDFDFDDGSSDNKKLNKVWNKLNPSDEMSTTKNQNNIGSMIHEALVSKGIIGKRNDPATRKEPLTKEEFLDEMKDSFKYYNKRLPSILKTILLQGKNH